MGKLIFLFREIKNILLTSNMVGIIASQSKRGGRAVARLMARDIPWMRERFETLKSQNLLWEPPTLESASTPSCTVDGKEMIMLSANNYLNLTTHPKVVAASIAATEKYGVGSGSVRAISGTMDIHLEAEKKVAEFKGVEASLIYSAGYTANVGLIPTLVSGKQDVIISDELNHGSIIDGVRLTKASRAVYPHNDVGALEEVLRQHSGSERKLIITDGVFSMDGDVAPLDEITELAEEHGAMVFVDDCHGEGVLGDGGAGIVDHFKLQGRVDFEIGSFSKALGVQGGIVAGSEQVRNHALNHSRSWLLSGSQPPGVAAAQKAAVEVLMEEPEHHARLWQNTDRFRREMDSLGFDLGMSTTPIIPVMCGESSVAKQLSAEMRKLGVAVGAIIFPMVARDKARVRNQLSTGLTDEQLDEILIAYETAGKIVNLI
jgi:glycine C-acetyltransferase